MAEKRLAMLVDIKRCIGCHTCAVVCKQENNLPNDIWWNKTLTDGGKEMDTAKGQYPLLEKEYFTLACQQCSNPACVKVCPVGATYVDPTTGIVRQDYDVCIGCRMCIAACPYTGVRSFNWEEPKHAIDFPVGGSDVPPHQKHVVEKCTFCYHRVAKDEEPACIEVCPAKARFFGDLNDPDSEVSQIINDRHSNRLLESEGTEPNVYFLT